MSSLSLAKHRRFCAQYHNMTAAECLQDSVPNMTAAECLQYDSCRVLTNVRKHLQNSLPEPRILFSSQIVLYKIKLYLLYGSTRLFWGMGIG